jgi:Fe-S oxidoreductase
MARRRLQEAEEVGAEVVLTECNSCVHNLTNAKMRKQKFRICSTTQFINELMEGQKSEIRISKSETNPK